MFQSWTNCIQSQFSLNLGQIQDRKRYKDKTACTYAMLIINAQEKRNIKQSSELLAHCFTTLKTGNKSTSRALQKSMYRIQCCREMPNAQSKAITMGPKPFLKSHLTFFKVDSIPSLSPSVEIQITGGEVCLRCKGKTLLGVVNKLQKTKCLLTSPSNVLPYYLK